MIYTIDSSAFIDLGERHYPESIKVFKPIWDRIYHGIEANEIISVDKVALELNDKAADWRTAFLARADRIFVMNEKIEGNIARVVQTIENGAQFLKNSAQVRFMKGADPVLIAQGLCYGKDEITVVSGETKNLTAYGLGAVCKEFGVLHMPVLEFIAKTVR